MTENRINLIPISFKSKQKEKKNTKDFYTAQIKKTESQQTNENENENEKHK